MSVKSLQTHDGIQSNMNEHASMVLTVHFLLGKSLIRLCTL